MDIKKFLAKLKDWVSESKESHSEKKGEMYFILIGIDQYNRLNNLDYCKADSESFLNVWNSSVTYNIKNKNIYKLYDSKATKSNIISLFDNLSKTIGFNDKVVIHLAGREFTNYKMKFFIPTDGEKENIYSCLSSLTINRYIRDIKCSNILMIGNTYDIDLEEKSKNDWVSFLEDYNDKEFDIRAKQDSIYSYLISFLRKNESNRNKEIFFLSRDKFRNKITDERAFGHWHIDDEELKAKIKEDREFITKLIRDGKTKQALNIINKVVSNNDPHLKSQVETLKYKYNQVSDESSSSISKKEEKKETETQISELSEGIIEKVDNCGFYLVNLPSQRKGSILPAKEKNIILFTSADPSDQSRLRLSNEFRDIEFELMRSKNRDLYELVPCLATRIYDFQRKLLDLKPQYVHFSGHGNCNGICFIGNKNDEANTIDNEPLAKLFGVFSKYIKCVFLNSCHSINQSRPIGKHVEKVVCMNSSVDDKTAIHFASAFYAALASGQNVDFSFDFAKNSINLHRLSGSDIPQLLSNTN